MNIRFVPQDEIDKVKWNSCVHYAINGNIFGYMWYLDNAAKEWDALVEDDYVSVFPLIWRYKYLKVKELYQPDLIRESGIYSINALSPNRVNSFLNAIPKDLKYINIHLNDLMYLAPEDGHTIAQKYNHQLILNKTYEQITSKYSPQLSQKLEKAQLANLTATSNLKPEKIVDFYKKHTPHRRNLDRRYHAYLRIMYNVLHRGWGFGSGILDTTGELLATAFFMYSHNKVIALLSASSPRGKELAADVFLFNALIQKHADKPMILDFNSSDEMALDFGVQQNSFQQLTVDKRKWGLF